MNPRPAPIFSPAGLAACLLATLPAAAQQKRVYIAPDDHTDYFWTADDATYEQVFLDSLDYYLAQIDATAGNPPEQQGRWNCDGSLWMWTYERHRPPALFDDLIDKIRSGHVSVPLNALAVSLGGAPAEVVLRGMYYSGRIERRYGLRFPLAYLMEDQTHPLGITSLWAGSGARWSWKGICGCDSQIPSAWDREHDLYVARGLDGAEVLMKWNSQLGGMMGMGGYAEAADPFGVVDFVTTQAAGNGFLARYPYDVIGCFGHGWDFLQVKTDVFITAAQTLSNPSRLVIVSNEQDFFEDFEATYDRAILPRQAVSFGNEWELYVPSLAETSARIKRSVEKLRAAEALAAIESLFDPLFAAARESDRDQACMNWGIYFEHNFGMIGTPMGAPGVAGRLQWYQRLADEIDAYVDGLHADGLAAVGRRIPGGAGTQRFFAFNPLGWTRTDFADFPYAGASPFHVVDVATQAEVPAQLVTTNGPVRIRILAKNVPSLGYRVYEVRPGAGSASFPPAAVVNGSQAVGQYYAARLEDSGAISSLVDRTQGGRQFAALVGGRWINDLGGLGGSVTVEDTGPVSVTLRADSPSPRQHTTRMTLYAGVRRVDIENRITENFDDVQTWSFGFNLDSPRVHHEEVGALLDAHLEQDGGHYSDRNARYDWLTLNHFADMSGSDGAGVTLSNADCFYFQLGDSTVESLDTSTPRLSAVAGGWIANGPQGLPSQGGATHFLQRFALRPHGGYDPTEAMRMALEHQNPLACGPVSSQTPALPADLFSAVSISDPHVLLWAFKPSEEGIQAGLIARVWNVDDAPHQADLQLALAPILTARGTTHIETDETIEPVGPAGLAVSVGAQQMRTYRLLFAQPTTTYCTPKINSLGCTPRISWSGTPSLTAGSGFVLSASDVLSKVPGVFFYGRSGAGAKPFQGGILCVAPPLKRTPGMNAGGSGACGGLLSFDFNTYAASGKNPALAVGDVLHGQFWSRDPQDPFSSSLTDAIEFTLGP